MVRKASANVAVIGRVSDESPVRRMAAILITCD